MKQGTTSQLDIFYNTTRLKDEALAYELMNAKKQEDRILSIYLGRGVPLTPWEVKQIYRTYHPDIPITSVRRSITNLTKRGKLMKMEDKEIGHYGKPNYKWKII